MTNKEYEAARNKLLPQAMRYANAKTKEAIQAGEISVYDSHRLGAFWNRRFARRMNRLTREAGLNAVQKFNPFIHWWHEF